MWLAGGAQAPTSPSFGGKKIPSCVMNRWDRLTFYSVTICKVLNVLLIHAFLLEIKQVC